VQRHLQPAAHGRAVDERERRDRQLAQPAEDVVAERADGQRLLAGGHLGRALEVGADGEDEGLARHAHRGQIRALGDLRQRPVEREQAVRAERVRLGVVEAVVQGDQRHRARAVRELHVAHQCLGDDFVAVALAQQRPPGLKIAHARFSQITVPPMPMPTHMVVMP
jgi:hypothetical protein